MRTEMFSFARERERNLFLYRKSIYKIQNNLTKHNINKYNDFLMRGSEKTIEWLKNLDTLMGSKIK